MEDARDSVHLDQVLDVLLVVQPLLREQELLVTVKVASAPSILAAASESDAAAAAFEASDHPESEKARVEVSPLLELGPELILGLKPSLHSKSARTRLEILLAVQALEHRFLRDEDLVT